jgi:hypothetical protein
MPIPSKAGPIAEKTNTEGKYGELIKDFLLKPKSSDIELTVVHCSIYGYSKNNTQRRVLNLDCSSATGLIRVVCFDDKPQFLQLFNVNTSGSTKLILGDYWTPTQGKIVVQEHTRAQILSDGHTANDLIPTGELNENGLTVIDLFVEKIIHKQESLKVGCALCGLAPCNRCNRDQQLMLQNVTAMLTNKKGIVIRASIRMDHLAVLCGISMDALQQRLFKARSLDCVETSILPDKWRFLLCTESYNGRSLTTVSDVAGVPDTSKKQRTQ